MNFKLKLIQMGHDLYDVEWGELACDIVLLLLGCLIHAILSILIIIPCCASPAFNQWHPLYQLMTGLIATSLLTFLGIGFYKWITWCHYNYGQILRAQERINRITPEPASASLDTTQDRESSLSSRITELVNDLNAYRNKINDLNDKNTKQQKEIEQLKHENLQLKRKATTAIQDIEV